MKKKLCECGCGRATPIARFNRTCAGWIKGQPMRFVQGHGGDRKSAVTHGMSRTRIYKVWCSMNSRCSNSQDAAYAFYGGRGISVCRRWKSFESFYADMGQPAKGMTLERKDNGRGYSKTNCVWATRQTQQRNLRNNRWYSFRGQQKLLGDIALATGIPRSTLYARIHDRGMSVGAAVAA